MNAPQKAGLTFEPWEIDPQALEDAEDQLRVELMSMASEYTHRNRIQTDPTPERSAMQGRVFRLRDACTYRAWSLSWHASVLYDRRVAVWHRLDHDLAAAIEMTHGDPTPFLRHIQQQFFLLDDIIFNTLSLFDYLANLVSVTRLQGRPLKWTQLVTICRKKHCRLRGDLPHRIVDADKRWIKRMTGFRGELIHNEDLPKLGEQSFDRNTNTGRWRIWMPEAWKGTVTKLGLVGPERIEMEDAGFAIAQAALTTAAGIVRVLHETFPWAPWTWEQKKRGTGVPP